jgi:hypothetical protein
MADEKFEEQVLILGAFALESVLFLQVMVGF